jgi:hypothetical protein
MAVDDSFYRYTGGQKINRIRQHIASAERLNILRHSIIIYVFPIVHLFNKLIGRSIVNENIRIDSAVIAAAY